MILSASWFIIAIDLALIVIGLLAVGTLIFWSLRDDEDGQ